MKAAPFKNRNLQAWILLLTLAIIWGSSFILIKKGLYIFSPGQLGSLRLSLAFLFLIPYAVSNIRKVPKDKWLYIILVGVISIMIPAFLFAIAQTKLTSSITSILNALTPLFTLTIGIVIFKFKMRFAQLLGLLLGFVGSISLSFINSEGEFGQMNFFVLFIVVATICYGAGSNIVKARLSDVNSTVLASLSLLIIGPFTVVYLFSTDFIDKVVSTEGSLEALGYIAILGIVGTGLALALVNRLIQITTPVFTSTVTYLIPIVAVMWGLLDNEKLYLMHYAGMVLIIAGVYIVNKVK